MGESSVATEDTEATSTELSPEEITRNAQELNTEMDDVLPRLPQYQNAEPDPKAMREHGFDQRSFYLNGDYYTVRDFRNAKEVDWDGFIVTRMMPYQPEIEGHATEDSTWGTGGTSKKDGEAMGPHIRYNRTVNTISGTNNEHSFDNANTREGVDLVLDPLRKAATPK